MTEQKFELLELFSFDVSINPNEEMVYRINNHSQQYETKNEQKKFVGIPKFFFLTRKNSFFFNFLT